jgi:hypothetical protein
MKRNLRRRKLIEPRIQLKFAAIFLTTAFVAVLSQVIMIGFMVGKAATALPRDGALLTSHLPEILRNCFLLTTVFLVPLTLVIGINSTHKIVGPLYRFRIYLNEIAAGKNPRPCKIRTGDELHDFCDLLNRATEPLRAAQAAASEAESAAQAGVDDTMPALPQRDQERQEA